MIEKTIRESVECTAEELRSSNVDCLDSGSTLVFVLIVNSVGYFANIGDSRAVVYSKSIDIQNNIQYNIPSFTTIDHKPDELIERCRVESMGGRVFASS